MTRSGDVSDDKQIARGCFYAVTRRSSTTRIRSNVNMTQTMTSVFKDLLIISKYPRTFKVHTTNILVSEPRDCPSREKINFYWH